MSKMYVRIADQDVEVGSDMAYDTSIGAEQEALLPSSRQGPFEEPVLSPREKSLTTQQSQWPRLPFSLSHVSVAFVSGLVSCVLLQLVICGPSCFSPRSNHSSATIHTHNEAAATALAPPYVGSTEVHNFPPSKPTNVFPSLFPTNVGYGGATPTGAEPAVIATAPSYPFHSGSCPNQLVHPDTLPSSNTKTKLANAISKGFKLFQNWGNLSPWFSVERGRFGLQSGPEPPETCRITGLHFLHRHGARYPTAWSNYGGPANFATKLHQTPESWNATGILEFLNDWTYKLGEELLTPFGRQQLYDLGISTRMKYGFLLQNFTESNTVPVFRTESQDRMLASAMNFAIGFFGYPFEGHYQQSITIEADGFNNTLAPYKTCPNAQDKSKSERGLWYIERWSAVYLNDARKRLAPMIKGFDLTIQDVYTMQQLCPYETVALGYSKFCELFTEEEWLGFDYALDLSFWYGSAFGSPVARVQGVGYIQELIARLTHTPIETHNSSTNATLNDNPTTFPLGQSLYVDATHEVVVLNILTALNLTTLAASGPLPHTHIPPNRSFRVAELAPFATNVQFQLLACSSTPDPQIRIIVNDGVVPLTGIRGCPDHQDGMCPVGTFVESQKEILRKTDWNYDCHGDWTLPEGPAWETVTGDAPRF